MTHFSQNLGVRKWLPPKASLNINVWIPCWGARTLGPGPDLEWRDMYGLQWRKHRVALHTTWAGTSKSPRDRNSFHGKTKMHLPFPLSFSLNHTVNFSRDDSCDITARWMQKQIQECGYLLLSLTLKRPVKMYNNAILLISHFCFEKYSDLH